jgi:MFS superfamily sulfate permease-like transporter
MLSTKHFKSDIFSGLVVFLVALPLCLGIALGSKVDPISGIIAGVIGGIIIGFISNSNVSVSGPAAGLIAIVVSSVATLGSFQIFLLAVILAGVIQVLLGVFKLGSLANFIPNSVIEGMLAGIGITIFLKQLPHAVGYDKDFEGDDAFFQPDGENTFTEIFKAFDYVSLGAITVCLISLSILILWDKFKIQNKVKFLPGALVAVIVSICLSTLFIGTSVEISTEHLVKLPTNFTDIKKGLSFPDFSQILNGKMWLVAGTIAVVASIETLLCVEAADKLDPEKRYTNPNLELKAQGIGNIISGLIGGLPMTSVVVRTSANVNAGGKTKLSAITHGVLLLVSVLTIPFLLNKIPYATLAAVLLLIGYKLASPKLFMKFYKLGWYQFLPFVITVIGVVAIDLLKGVLLGLFVSIFFILKGNLKKAYSFDEQDFHDGDKIKIKLAQEVSFLNKAAIKESLQSLPENTSVTIDASDTVYIDHDVIELIEEFCKFTAKEKNISFKLKGLTEDYHLIEENQNSNNIKIKHKK